MTLRVSKTILVDGEEYGIDVDVGSIGEGIAFLKQLQDQAGAAPSRGAGPAAVKRGRKTKAEMESARALAAAAVSTEPSKQPPALPPGAMGQVFPPPPSAQGGPQVGFSDAASLPVGQHSVGFAPPPGAPPAYAPPPPAQVDPRVQAWNDVANETQRVIALNPAWEAAVLTQRDNAIHRHGPNLESLNVDQLQDVYHAVVAYGEQVQRHLANQQH